MAGQGLQPAELSQATVLRFLAEILGGDLCKRSCNTVVVLTAAQRQPKGSITCINSMIHVTQAR